MATFDENIKFKNECKLNFDMGFDFNSSVYRVFTIERLLEIFRNKNNTLVKPELWDDPFENFLLKQTIKINDGMVHLDEIRKCLYGQCWTLHNKETDALWRIYSPNKNGVRVKTTLQKLWDSYYNSEYSLAMISFFIGKILYMNEIKIKNYFENPRYLKEIFTSRGSSLVNTLLIKRMEFLHENEVRLIYLANSNGKDISKSIFQYQIDPMILFEELLFDPRFDEGVYNAMFNELSRLGYDKNKVFKSQLYKTPTLNLTLNDI